MSIGWYLLGFCLGVGTGKRLVQNEIRPRLTVLENKLKSKTKQIKIYNKYIRHKELDDEFTLYYEKEFSSYYEKNVNNTDNTDDSDDSDDSNDL